MPRPKNRPPFYVFIALLLFCQFVSFAIAKSGVRYWVNDGLPILSETVIDSSCYLVLFAVLVIALYFIRKATTGSVDLPVAFIAAGAASNLLDRIFRGGVMDYVSLWVWPSFNVADAFIVVGVTLLVAKLFTSTSRL